MKITQIMLGKGFGGAERYFVDLSQALTELGHDVQAICHIHFSQIDKLTSINNVCVVPVMAWGWWDIFAQREIRKVLDSFRPEIVHAHLARAAHHAGKPCTQLGIPLVVKTHNYVDLKYYRHVNHFITTTQDQRRYLEGKGIRPEHIDVIPNFSSVAAVDKINLKSNETIQLMSYGRFVRKKGFHVLLGALKKMLVAGQKVRLKIGGDGPERKNLVEQVHYLGLTEHVEFSGWIENVADYAADADIFVLPSLDEPFGIAVLEMMARGIPVVSTRTQGPQEILNSAFAWMVEPDNVNALTDTLIEASNDSKVRAQKAAMALSLFKQQYSKQAVVPGIVDLYRTLSKLQLH